MRLLWEIFTFIAGIGVLFAVAKGFPAFGRVLMFLLLNPIGIAAVVGMIFWITLRRRRNSGDRPA
mgnify:CR=1 FL=1